MSRRRIGVKDGFVALKPWSRDWWITWFKHRLAGRASQALLMVKLAKRGTSWTIPIEECPTDEERSACATVLIESDGFRRWDAWCVRTHLSRMPKPAHVPVVFAPTPLPE